MTLPTKLFLLTLCSDIIENNLDHDCRRQDGCVYCAKAQEAIEQLNMQDIENPTYDDIRMKRL